MQNVPKNVLITGCSSGIGAALAKAFHHTGKYTVYASARRLDSLAPLQALGIQTLTLDVTDHHSIQAAVDQIEGGVDILVNNAGYGLMGPLAEVELAQLRQQWETNVTGLLAVTQAVLPSMIAKGRGTVFNIGSVSGVLITPFAGAYCASKAAANAISDTLRMELAPFGVKVVTVQPGAIQSQFGATSHQGLKPWRWYQPFAKAIEERAGASQDGSTSAEDFAAVLVNGADNPPAVWRIGNKSGLAIALAKVPRALRERLLQQKYGLLGRKSA
jgi:NADP-dependent 3-hydroxy acid dehydrogenase YdfG